MDRWLSLAGICSVLDMTEANIKFLVKNGFLEVMWTDKVRTLRKARFFEPNADYANRLRVAEEAYGRRFPAPPDKETVPMLSLTEVSEIMGWDKKTAKKHVNRKLLKGTRCGIYVLYSMADVRDLMWKKSGYKSAAGKRAPFLLTDLIRYFLSFEKQERELVPSDNDFRQDDLVAKQIAVIMKMPADQQQIAMLDLWNKVDLAKSAVALLRL